MTTQLKPLSTDVDGADIVIKLVDADGKSYEARLPTMAAMSMVSALTVSLKEAAMGDYPVDTTRRNC